MTVHPEAQPRNAVLAGGGNGPNGTPADRPLVPIDYALRCLGSKVDSWRRAAGGSVDFWEKYLRQQMGISVNAAQRFIAIPRAVDATLVAGALMGRIWAPDSYLGLQTPLRYVATARAAYQATQLLGSAVVGSYTTAMTAAALLARRCPNHPQVAKAIEFLKNHPQAKKLLITWYAATCASLVYNGHQALIKSMNVPQGRPALQTVDTDIAGGNRAGEGDENAPQAGRFNNEDLAKAVNALPTSRMSQGQLHDVARLAIARGKENRATEEALWKELRGLSVQYRAKANIALASAEQEFQTATVASAGAGGVGPLKVAADKAEMKLKKLQTDVMNREVQNLPVDLQRPISAQRAIIDAAALQSAINLDIFPLLHLGVDVFIGAIPALTAKYGITNLSSALRPILNCLREPIAPGGVPTWSKTRVDDFIESVKTRVGLNRFLAGGSAPIDAGMVARLSTKTYQLSLAAHMNATHARTAVVAALPAGTTLRADPALKAVEKQKAVETAEKASDLKLSSDAVTDIQTLKEVARTANQSYDRILYPDLTVMYNPRNEKEIWLSQVRREGATCHTTEAGFKKMLATQTSAKGRDPDGNTIVYFKIDPDKMLDLVLNHDIKNIDFEEGFFVTGLDSGSPTIAYGKPRGDQERLDHRLTAELFRVVGTHHQSSILKALASGNLHDKQPWEIEKIKKQMKFLDWINKNHFVTELPNGPSFMTHDRNYMNHAEAFGMIREELATQLAHRTATIATTEGLKAKRGIGAVIAEPNPEVAWGKKAALSGTMATLKGQLEEPHLGGLWSSLKVSFGGNNLRCRAFVDGCKGLLDSANALKAGLDGEANTHVALRLGVVSAQEDRRPLLEAFYRHAYMLQHMLENNHVRETILPTFRGDNKAAQATQLLADIKAAVTSVNNIYADYVDKVEYGAHAVEGTKTRQLKIQAEELAKIFANADFFLNGFERKSPTVIQQAKMALAGH